MIVKLLSGRPEKRKAGTAEDVITAVSAGANRAGRSVSVSIGDVGPGDGAGKVWTAGIPGGSGKLSRQPGHSPL